MKKLFIILIAIFLSASLLSCLTLNLMMDDNYNFWDIWLSVIIVALYEVPIYLVVGLPVTLLIDFVLKLTVRPIPKSYTYFNSYFTALQQHSLGYICISR